MDRQAEVGIKTDDSGKFCHPDCRHGKGHNECYLGSTNGCVREIEYNEPSGIFQVFREVLILRTLGCLDSELKNGRDVVLCDDCRKANMYVVVNPNPEVGGS